MSPTTQFQLIDLVVYTGSGFVGLVAFAWALGGVPAVSESLGAISVEFLPVVVIGAYVVGMVLVAFVHAMNDVCRLPSHPHYRYRLSKISDLLDLNGVKYVKDRNSKIDLLEEQAKRLLCLRVYGKQPCCCDARQRAVIEYQMEQLGQNPLVAQYSTRIQTLRLAARVLFHVGMLALVVALFRDLAYLVFEVMAIGFVALRSTFDLARVSIYLCIVVATLLLRYEEAYLEQRTRLVIAKGIIADILWNRTEWIGSRALKRS